MLERYQRTLRSLCHDTRGVAAIEMAFVALLLVVTVLNGVDVGLYAYKNMEVAECGAGGGAGSLENLLRQQLDAAGDAELCRIKQCDYHGDPKHDTRHRGDACLRLPHRGLLLRQQLWRPAVGRQPVQQTGELLGGR